MNPSIVDMLKSVQRLRLWKNVNVSCVNVLDGQRNVPNDDDVRHGVAIAVPAPSDIDRKAKRTIEYVE